MLQSESTVLCLLASRWPNGKRSGQKTKKNYMYVSDRYAESCPTTCPELEKTKKSTFHALACWHVWQVTLGAMGASVLVRTPSSNRLYHNEGHERRLLELVSMEESGLCCPLSLASSWAPNMKQTEAKNVSFYPQTMQIHSSFITCKHLYSKVPIVSSQYTVYYCYAVFMSRIFCICIKYLSDTAVRTLNPQVNWKKSFWII